MIYPSVYFIILLGATIKVIKFTKFTGAPAAAGQVMSSLVQPNKAVTIQNNITNRAPAPLLSGGLFQVTKPAPATATNGQDLFLIKQIFQISFLVAILSVVIVLNVDSLLF